MMFLICDSWHVGTHPGRRKGLGRAEAGGSARNKDVGCAVVSVWIRDASFRTFMRELGEKVGIPLLAAAK